MIDRSMDGLILIAPISSRRHLQAVARTVPTVVVGRHGHSADYDTVTDDDFAGAGLIVAHLAGLGHRHIAHIEHLEKDLVRLVEMANAQRADGYRHAMNVHGVADGIDIVSTTYTQEGGYRGAQKLLARETRPTAIFAGADIVAMGVLDALTEADLSAPGDISLAGYDNTTFAASGPFSLTTVDQAGHEMGVNAARLLLDRVADRTMPTAQVKLSPPSSPGARPQPRPPPAGADQTPWRLTSPSPSTTGGSTARTAASAYASTRPTVWPAPVSSGRHGGAFYGGDIDVPESDWVARRFAERGIAVVAVDYRLAPIPQWSTGEVPVHRAERSPYPVASEEVTAVFRWATTSDTRVPFGPSAAPAPGGALTAGASLRLRDEGGPLPHAVVLVYPVVHAALPPMTAELAAKVATLPDPDAVGAEAVRRMNLHYVGEPAALREPYAFPGGHDLTGLPPTFILNADIDSARAPQRTG